MLTIKIIIIIIRLDYTNILVQNRNYNNIFKNIYIERERTKKQNYNEVKTMIKTVS